jgi:tetratricopeptide (TPR) repeat protein
MKKAITGELAVAEPESEKILLERLQQAKTEEDYFRWLLFVVGFYRGLQRLEPAKTLIERYIEAGDNPQQIAHCYLALGQIETDEQKFEKALVHFVAALKLNPEKRRIIYVLHNNAGYCLNVLGRYTEAEHHCRLAIEVDSTRASGYRNLGVSFQGQGNLIAAAWALAEAVKADLSDGRARVALEKLVAKNPVIAVQCPWVSDGLYPSLKTAEAVPYV